MFGYKRSIQPDTGINKTSLNWGMEDYKLPEDRAQVKQPSVVAQEGKVVGHTTPILYHQDRIFDRM